MSENLKALYRQINNLNISSSEAELLKSSISNCIESQVEECAKALESVHNENEMTDSEVVWIDLDDSQEAVRKATINPNLIEG